MERRLKGEMGKEKGGDREGDLRGIGKEMA